MKRIQALWNDPGEGLAMKMLGIDTDFIYLNLLATQLTIESGWYLKLEKIYNW